MDVTVQFFSVIVVLLTFVLYVIIVQFIRRRDTLFPLRTIPAYAKIPLYVGEAIESSRPLHLSFGGASIGTETTVLALAGAELFYQTARIAAVSDISPIITMSNPINIPLGQDTLRRAYLSRGFLENYQSDATRWYPSGQRSLAFATALTAMIHSEKVSTNIMTGSFGSEMAFIAAASYRGNRRFIGMSDQLEGQAIGYALGNETLIGEELFVAGSYLEGQANQRAIAVTTDFLRWILILFMLGSVIVSLLETTGN